MFMQDYLIPMRVQQFILCLLVPSLNLTAFTLYAADPPRVAFHDVVVGETTETELISNKQWGRGQPVKTVPTKIMYKVLEYKVGIWKKVLVTISHDQTVWTIDVTPPDRARADDLAKILKLGKLIPIKSIDSLSADALIGLTIFEDWQAFHCDNASGVLIFTETVNQRLYVKHMRFYFTRQEHAKQHFEQGQAYMKQEEFEKAVNEFTETIRLNPKHLFAYTRRVAAHTEVIKKHEKSLTKFNKLIQSDPDNVMSYNKRGVVYMKMGYLDNAKEDFTTAIRLDPNNATGYYNRGYVEFNAEEYDRAIVDFNKAIQIDPKKAAAYYGRGHAHFRMGQTKKASEDRARAIQLDPKKYTRLHYKMSISD